MSATPTASADPAEPNPPSGAVKAEPAKSTPTGAAHELIELGKTVFYALLIAFVLRVVLFQPFTIPSESMEPTLLKGDYIIVSKFAYGWSRHSILFSPPVGHGRLLGHQPKRGDIIVFKLPRDGKTDYIKRLIGLPGDRVQVRAGVVYINGQPIRQDTLGAGTDYTPNGIPFSVTRVRDTLAGGKTFTTYLQGTDGQAENTGAYVVPQGCYFMMGDNRDNSADSRFDPGDVAPGEASCPWKSDVDHFVGDNTGVGFVPFENLEGRADIILFSWNPDVSLLKPWTWFLDARWGRFFHLLG